MTTRCLPILLMTLFFGCPLAWGGDLPWEQQLPFKEATIRYELTGSEQGKETLSIRDYGKQRAKHRKSAATVMGMTKQTDVIEITDPDWISSYDLLEKKGEKTTNPLKVYAVEYNKLNPVEKKNFADNAKELGASMLGTFGGSVKQKSGTILGYDCDVTTVNGISTVHLLHGTDIPLRTDVAIMGMNNVSAATAVDTSTPVPASAFAAPPGISAELNQEADAMMTAAIRRMVDTLKRPDGAKQMRQAGPLGMMDMGAGGMEQDMQREMAAEGMSAEEQQELMRQMQQAMEQMQKMQPTR